MGRLADMNQRDRGCSRFNDRHRLRSYRRGLCYRMDRDRGNMGRFCDRDMRSGCSMCGYGCVTTTSVTTTTECECLTSENH